MTAKNPQDQDQNQNRDQTATDAADAPAHAQHPDRQQPGQGKVENDHNRIGHQEPTQKNEGQRTPDSRSDRTSHIGSGNQNQTRQGNAGSGGGRGAG